MKLLQCAYDVYLFNAFWNISKESPVVNITCYGHTEHTKLGLKMTIRTKFCDRNYL